MRDDPRSRSRGRSLGRSLGHGRSRSSISSITNTIVAANKITTVLGSEANHTRKCVRTRDDNASRRRRRRTRWRREAARSWVPEYREGPVDVTASDLVACRGGRKFAARWSCGRTVLRRRLNGNPTHTTARCIDLRPRLAAPIHMDYELQALCLN